MLRSAISIKSELRRNTAVFMQDEYVQIRKRTGKLGAGDIPKKESQHGSLA